MTVTLGAQCVWIKSNGVKKCVAVLPSNLVPWSSMPVAPPGTVREQRDTLIVPIPDYPCQDPVCPSTPTVSFMLSQANPYNIKVFLNGLLLALGAYGLAATVDAPGFVTVVTFAIQGQTIEAIYNF